MQILYTDPHILHICSQILRHAFGQCCNQDLVFLLRLLADLADQMIDLPFYRMHGHLGIQQPRRTYHLLGTQKLMFCLIRPRCGRDKKHTGNMFLKLIKIQRPVILCRWQTESVIHQCPLAGLIPMVHRPHLRYGHMGLIYNDQEILRKVVHQGIGRLSWSQPGQVPGIILDP